MRQIDRFVERTTHPPAGVQRVFSIVVPVAMVGRAIGTHRPDHVAIAVCFVVLMLPSGIAPKRHWELLRRLEEHRVLDFVFMFVLLACLAFGLLAEFLPLRPSLVVGLCSGLAFSALAEVTRRKRRSTSG